MDFDGTVYLNYDLLVDGSIASAMYTNLTMAENGDLYAAWFTQTESSPYYYRSIHTARSTDAGTTWTKLDGTAKGGVIIGISDQFKHPIRYIGVGEKASDLREFNTKDYLDSLFADA